MPATTPLLQEGRYRITNEFRNGTGFIYDAYDTVSETNVVVREIPRKSTRVSTVSRHENLNVALAEQARVLTEINHESVLHVRDVFSEIGRQYVVVDSVDGDDLQALLETRKGPFQVREVTAWADQLLDALHYLHTYRSPLVHRDIRPANIKLDADGRIKLVTLGLVGKGSDDNADMGQSGQEPSGIAYSPLEQIWSGLDAASQKVIISKYDERSERILKDDLDARSDIYSLGATLYHLATAKLPVDSLERSIEILEGNPDPLFSPNKIDPDIPVEISDVIVKAMEVRREYRFDSAAIMRQVLRTALIRVKERESAEAEEIQEALYDLGLKNGSVPVEPSTAISETELIRQQLQEAETLRQAAEMRALEAEKLLHESESTSQPKVVPQAVANFDDDLLGVLDSSFHVSEAPVAKAAQDDISLIDVVDEVDHSISDRHDEDLKTEDAGENELEAESEPVSPPQEFVDSASEPNQMESDESFAHLDDESEEIPEVQIAPESDGLAVSEPLDEMPAEEAEEVRVTDEASSDADHDESMEGEPVAAVVLPVEPELSETPRPPIESDLDSVDSQVHDEPTGFGFGKAIAIGAGVLIVAAIGVWMMMSSGTQQPAKATTTENPAATPFSAPEPEIKSAFQQSELPVVEQTDPASTITDTGTPAAAKPATTAAPKPKKPAPPKTPAQKKVVTVDDLINDN